MADAGVRYPGSGVQPVDPILAVTGRPDPLTGRSPSDRAWHELVREVVSAGDARVVLSSELLADAEPAAIRTIAHDLDASRIHVVITPRPLASVLAAEWQRLVGAGARSSFDTWLDGVLDGDEEGSGPVWQRLRSDRLVARWAEVVGPANLTVIAPGDADDDMGLRTIEALTGLPTGTLAVPPNPVDRPLTAPETEVVRAFNERFHAEGLGSDLHARVMRFGAVPYLRVRTPDPAEAPVPTPFWAVERAASISSEMIRAIADSGVRVVGDLARLIGPIDARSSNGSDPAITPRIAARLAVGVLLSSGLVRGGAERIPRPADAPETLRTDGDGDAYIPRPAIEPLALARMTTVEIVGALAGRARSSIAALPRRRRRRQPIEARPDPAPLLVAPGTRLVHIGPFKTGTTSLQAAFHAHRREVSAQGVHYTGPLAQPVIPVLAVTRRTQAIYGAKPPRMIAWRALLFEVRRAREPRVVISSEFFSDAGPEAIERIVHDLDAARVHVVVTLRPLARILASQWQQFVQSGATPSYPEWLRATFDRPSEGPAGTFWRRHRHDELIARWAAVAGPANVTALALDDRDPGMVLRAFEQLTGLQAGTLVTPIDSTNRSMTLAEVETVRAFNGLASDEGIAAATVAKVMRYGAATYMKERDPEADEARIPTPGWALDRARAVQGEMVERIARSGVRVVGDLSGFVDTGQGNVRSADDATEDPAGEPLVAVPSEVAARAGVGVVLAAGLAKGRPAADPLDRLVTVQIGAVLARRMSATARRPVHRLRRLVRRSGS
jgi:hypothetical protein